MILRDIIEHKRSEIAARRRGMPMPALRRLPLYAAPRRSLRDALAAAPPPAIIAELKRASPSRGVIRADYDPVALAQGYVAAGATALSVLTDTRFFGGTLEHLAAVRAAVTVPCLRKDFVVDPYQVEEARAFGADAVLLIAAAVSRERGEELLATAEAAGLDVLVEVHDASELDWAAHAGATLIGVNNRDLHTFEVTLETAERLLPLAPPEAIVVAESGVRSADDVRRMVAAGARAVLVGEAFMETADPGATLAGWMACLSA
jgi:indole-3-glycerol phosphate synthase